MKENKTFFDYIAITMCIFSVAVISTSLFSFLFGAEAQGVSSLFALGNQGLSLHTLFQFLLFSILLTVNSVFWFQAKWFSKLQFLSRTIFMMITIVLLVAVFAAMCNWFPFQKWQAWAMFFLCFGVCFTCSIGISIWKTKLENKKMQQELQMLQKKFQKKI